jgi:hypothetical protein
MAVFLQIAIAALLFLIVFAIVFVAGAIFGYIVANSLINDPERIKQRLENELRSRS